MEFVERMGKIPVHKFSDYASYIDAGTKSVWAAFRACHLTAGVIVKTNCGLVDPSGKALVRVDPILERLLRHPNPYDSWEELVYVWTFHMKLTGNAFWLKDEMDGRGRPKHLFPLMPQFMKVIPDRHRKVGGYNYSVNGNDVNYDVEEIIHFRRPSPSNPLLGIGDIEPAEVLFNDQINRGTYNERFMENGASPSGVLIREDTDGVETTEWERLKAWWNASYSGKKNIGKTAFLNGKWSYQQLGLSAQQMQGIEKDKLSIEQIFTAMGVPLSVAGIRDAAHYATSKQDDINFRKNECVPLIDILVARINSPEGFVRAFGDGLRLDYSLGGLVDVEQIIKEYKPLVDMGAMTLNEIRVMAGLPKLDSPMHDQFYVTGQVVPLEMVGLSNPPEADLNKIVFGLTGKGV